MPLNTSMGTATLTKGKLGMPHDVGDGNVDPRMGETLAGSSQRTKRPTGVGDLSNERHGHLGICAQTIERRMCIPQVIFKGTGV
jgi:hypothetical protein